jgi:hypothetical protein
MTTKAAKTSLDFVVYTQVFTCVAFEFMQLILHLIYTYSSKDGAFKSGPNLHLYNVAVDCAFFEHTLAHRYCIIMDTHKKIQQI